MDNTSSVEVEDESEISQDEVELYDESYETEIRLNKRTFYLNRLDKTENGERCEFFFDHFHLNPFSCFLQNLF